MGGPAIVLRPNLAWRVTGALYAVYGFLALWQVSRSLGAASEVNLFACAILGGFGVFGLGLLGFVEDVSLDPGALEYEFRKGFWPFLRKERGSTRGLRAIVIERSEDSTGDGEAVLFVKMVWTDGREAVLFSTLEETLLGSQRAKASVRATRLAAALGVACEGLPGLAEIPLVGDGILDEACPLAKDDASGA